MTHDELLKNRNSYSYPSLALAGEPGREKVIEFDSTVELDNYLHQLLHSDHSSKVVLGILSVVFWGHYSGQDGKTNTGYALNKAHQALDGNRRQKRTIRSLGFDFVLESVKKAKKCIADGRHGDAVNVLTEIPQMQIPFASKVCAFIAPEWCGVIDSVIVASYPQFEFETDPAGYVRKNRRNLRRYDTFCRYLKGRADVLNTEGTEWTDTDGNKYPWRAVDVERAMYCSLADVANPFDKYGEWVKKAHHVDPPGCEGFFVDTPYGFNDSMTVGIVHEHRFAFYYWALHTRKQTRPTVLVTVDSHCDVGAHSDVIPEDLDNLDISNETELGIFCWLRLCHLNDGHILPALHLDMFEHVFVLLKKESNPAHIVGKEGRRHDVRFFTDEEELLDALPFDSHDIYLDLDLDYFSDDNSEQDFEHGGQRQWPESRIRGFLSNEGGLVQEVLPSLKGFTIALEPKFCRGLANSLNALNILNDELFGGSLCTNRTEWRKACRPT